MGLNMLMRVSSATSKWLKIAEDTSTDDQKSLHSNDNSSNKSCKGNDIASNSSEPDSAQTARPKRGSGSEVSAALFEK